MTPAAQQAIPPTLSMGQPIERELSGGEVHEYRLPLSANQFVEMVVMQRGIDVVLSLYDPLGQRLAEVDSPNGSQGTEPLALITPADGDYRLEVRSLQPTDPVGHYEARLVTVREALASDQIRVEAARLFAMAQALKQQGTADALRSALASYEEALARWVELDDAGRQAAILNEIGTTYADLRDNDNALAAHTRALPLRRTAGDRSGEAETLTNIGSAHDAMGDKPRAIEYYEQALALFRAEGYRYGEAIALSNIATAESYLGHNQAALLRFQESVLIFREIGDRLGEATALNNLGGLYYSISEFPKALEQFTQVLPLVRAVGERRGEGYTLSNIALIHDTQGERTLALESYEQARAILRDIGDTFGEGTVLNNLGLLYSGIGEKQRALDYYFQGLGLKQALNDRDGQASILNGIGAVYASIGEGRTALGYVSRALELNRAVQDRSGEAATLNNVGRIQSDMGEWAAARKSFADALALWRTIDDRDGQASALLNLGAAARSEGDLTGALASVEQALALYRDVGNPSGVATALTDGSAVLRQLGDRDRAAAHLSEALPLRRAVQDRPGEATTITEQGRLARANGELTSARILLEQALEITENLRARMTSEAWRASYLAKVRDGYELYVDVLMQLEETDGEVGYAALALRASEMARARSLLDLLSEARIDIREGVDTLLLEREHELQSRLTARAERYSRLLARDPPAARATPLEREIAGLTAELQELSARIRATSPQYAALALPVPASLGDIRDELLDAETLLLEYALGEDHSYLWVLSKQSLASFTLPPRAEIEAVARDFYDHLTERNRGLAGESTAARNQRVQQADRAVKLAGATLSHMLLGPATPLLGSKRLIIVADGALQNIPFSALPDPGDSTSAARVTPLVVNHEIVHAPSASVLVTLTRGTANRAPAPRSIAVLADPVFSGDDPRVRSPGVTQPPTAEAGRELSSVERAVTEAGIADNDGRLPRLPFTRREAESILGIVGASDALAALDFAATRDLIIRGDLEPYRLLHFATHGLINNEHPDLSGMVLDLVDERGQPVNGFLRLHDIYNLRLPAELVVLSACQTALGPDVRGEGLIGLTRGFMYAGAARVLASLWKVDDAATATLMGRFYEGMFRQPQQSPAAALRTAQVSLWREARWSSAYYWAAFTLQGRW
jgi:CHAT domain-containing protein/Tfp pilus assembly protein PilF